MRNALNLHPASEGRTIRLTKSGEKRFAWSRKYIRSELKTGRHILASLGSAGLTFISDIDAFKQYLKSKGDTKLVGIIERDRALTKSEIKNL